VWEAASVERRERAERRYERCFKLGQAKAGVLPRDAWLACEIIKLGWRAIHPAIQEAWSALESAAREAIETPGRVVEALRGAYVVKHGFLWRLTASGGTMAYASPKLTQQFWCRVDDNDEAEALSAAEIEAWRRKGFKIDVARPSGSRISAAGVNSQTRKMERYGLYGGLLFENDVQHLAACLLKNGMLKAEAAGYPIVLHVHDEPVAEVPRGFGSVEHFSRVICELPAWAEGLPLTASGYRAKRYRKG